MAAVDAGARVVATTVGASVARLALAPVWSVEPNTHATQDSCPTAPVRLSNVDGRYNRDALCHRCFKMKELCITKKQQQYRMTSCACYH